MQKKLCLSIGCSLMALLAIPGFGVAAQDENGTASLVHVGLNPSTCGTVPGKASGVVNVHLNAVQDRFTVNVAVHDALPTTTYVVDIRCQGKVGALTTNAQGTGTAQIDLPASASGPASEPFYIDVEVPNGGGGAGGYGDSFIAGPFNLG